MYKKSGSKRKRLGRGNIPKYPKNIAARLREKRCQDFQKAQDVLSGFDKVSLKLYASGDQEFEVNGRVYTVGILPDEDRMDDEFYEVVDEDKLRFSNCTRGDWCDDPASSGRRNEYILLAQDCRLMLQYGYWKDAKVGKAAAMDQAIRSRNSLLECARKHQRGDFSYYGVTVVAEDGESESLWGVSEDNITDTVRELVSELQH